MSNNKWLNDTLLNETSENGPNRTLERTLKLAQVGASMERVNRASVLMDGAVAGAPSFIRLRSQPYNGAAQPSQVAQQVGPRRPPIVAPVPQYHHQRRPREKLRTPFP